MGVSTLLWLNLSPFYIARENSQVATLQLIYDKIGSGMGGFNDMVPRTRTSTEIDRRTRQLYAERNGSWAGTYYPEEDEAPPLLPQNLTTQFSKKVYK